MYLYSGVDTAIRKGLSLTEFYSGATTHSGRFSEGLLLRRSHIEACATSHYWAREIAKFGHEVRRMASEQIPSISDGI